MQGQDLLQKDLSEKDFYEVLGCDPTSSKEQIITEYRIRARLTHPDKTTTTTAPATDTPDFVRLTLAYDVLSDDDQRQKYDKYLQSGLNIPFDAWIALNQKTRIMHWAVPKKKPTLPHH